ncbi:MAG: redoxin domain-containing protein [Bacteroidales bacterium]|nr:redoxin domain-containing protein [Bacteroidales bacterium]
MKTITLITVFFFSLMSYGQEYILDMTIHHFPEKECYLATFYGDKNAIIDTAEADTSGRIIFKLKPEYHTGMYRVFLEQDLFFDFIYNNENITLSSDYTQLYDKLEIIESEENMIYYEFLRKANEYRLKFDLLAPLNDYYPRADTFFEDARLKYIFIQADIQQYINEAIEKHPELWAIKVIRQKRPLYFDPSLDEYKRREYAREHYFDNVDFSDLELIKSNVYTTAAIDYISIYSNPNLTQDKLEDEFIKAVDKIMYQAMENGLIYEFIVEYLVGGFERYHFEKVLDYIAENYTPEQCENEERKSDLQTRLEKYAELIVGKKAPNFIIPDESDQQITLSKIKSDYTLVVFWSSSCPHCNELLPEINNICESSIDEEKMQVLTVSLDTEKEEWIAALKNGNYPWLNTSELKGWDSQVAIDYNIYATPTMFLLDKHKEIVAKPITFNELKEALLEENIIR